MSTQGSGNFLVNSKWSSGTLYFYEKAVGRTVTGDILSIGTTAVTVGGTSQDVDFGWYAASSKSFVLDAGAGTLTIAGIDVSLTGDLTIDTEDINLGDNDDMEFGDGQDTIMRWSTADASNHTFAIGLDNTSQQMHITDKAAIATDWNIAAVTHPTVYIHSNTTPATDYISIGGHDGTTATIAVAGGTTLNFTGAALTLGASGAGYDVTFYGDTAGSDFFWDQDGQTDGSLNLGTSAGSTGVDLFVYGDTAATYMHWDSSADDLMIIGTAARTLHGGDGAGNDVLFYGATASYAMTWDANGDTNGALYIGADTKGILTQWYGDTTGYYVQFDPSGDTNGAWYFGADTLGVQVNLYGDVTGCGVFWDPSTDTNGTLTIGGSGGSKGNDVIIYGAGNGSSLQWDQSADMLVQTSAVIGADARATRYLYTVATPAMTDGYGVMERDLTVTGVATGHISASSMWVNIGASATIPSYTFLRNDGFYDAGGTLTNAYIAMQKYQCLLASNPSHLSIWELNFQSDANNVVDSLFNVNDAARALGYAAGETGQGVSGTIPIFSIAGGGAYYIDVHSASA